MAAFLTQERFPWLWLGFQFVFGASRAKRRLALSRLGTHRNVLEIGCSMGIVAPAFADCDGVTYLGIDVDEQAIEIAKRRFRGFGNVDFAHSSLEDLVAEGRCFDYVLFANILHHADDSTSIDLLRRASELVQPGGTMLLIEPDVLRPDDGFVVRQFYKLERGEYRRSPAGYRSLIQAADLRTLHEESHDVSVDTLPGITCGHLLTFAVQPMSAGAR